MPRQKDSDLPQKEPSLWMNDLGHRERQKMVPRFLAVQHRGNLQVGRKSFTSGCLLSAGTPTYPAKRVPLFTPCGILEDTWSIQKEDIKPYLAPQMCHQLHLPVKGWTRAVFWTNGACQNPPGEFFLTNKDSRSHSSDSEPDSPGQALL